MVLIELTVRVYVTALYAFEKIHCDVMCASVEGGGGGDSVQMSSLEFVLPMLALVGVNLLVIVGNVMVIAASVMVIAATM